MNQNGRPPRDPRTNPPQNRQPNPQNQRPPQQNNAYRPIRQVPQMPQQYPNVRHRSRRQAKRAAGLALLAVIIFGMLLVSIIIFAARCASGEMGSGDDTEASTTPSVTTPLVTTAPPETTAETVSVEALYTTIEKTAADVHKGYLILVNYQNAFDFESGFKLIPIYGNKNLSYKVRDTIIQLETTTLSWFNKMMEAFEADMDKHDILVNSTVRSLEEQEAIYAMRVEQYGEEYAQVYVSVPGYSEHHTGLACDLAVFTDEYESLTFDKMTEYADWLTANGHKFGFIQRYQAHKTDITKIAYENWHYRYVGKPHAYYMMKKDLCLEEYIERLRKFSYAERLNFTDDDGIEWEVYFEPASPTGTTQLHVPKYQEYDVSGNNVDGFIVTVRVR
ncbi:MAG: D-alanyl-D-alanine carboxypeptidase family protein [Ruminococcaceae bacterium]|nr:D-alanyl-D-alanine carboxypeptidase family protein [Oscillospiraceae bacterium]